MRERLIAAFVLFAVGIVVTFGIVRAYTVRGIVDQSETDKLAAAATLLAALADEHADHREPLTSGDIDRYLRPAERFDYVDPQGRTVTARGRAYDPGASRTDLSRTVRPTSGGSLTLSLSQTVVDQRVADVVLSLVRLALGVVVAAAIVGYIVATRFARPFTALAVVATDLGDAEFTGRAPRFAIPEADILGQALQESSDRLKSMLRREREFSANASHQLRTPITALHLELEDLALWPETPPAVAEHLDRSVRELDRLNLAISDLLDLARGDTPLQSGVDLRDVMTAASERWRAPAEAKFRRIVVPDGPIAEVHCSRRSVEQILDTLIENAIVHGSGTITLEIRSYESEVGLIVGDEGVVEIDEGSFERNVKQADSPGEGIGLSLAVQIAAAMGARIRVGDGPTTAFELVIAQPLDG